MGLNTVAQVTTLIKGFAPKPPIQEDPAEAPFTEKELLALLANDGHEWEDDDVEEKHMPGKHDQNAHAGAARMHKDTKQATGKQLSKMGTRASLSKVLTDKKKMQQVMAQKGHEKNASKLLRDLGSKIADTHQFAGYEESGAFRRNTKQLAAHVKAGNWGKARRLLRNMPDASLLIRNMDGMSGAFLTQQFHPGTE